MNAYIYRNIIAPTWQILNNQKINQYLKEFIKNKNIPNDEIELYQLEKLKDLIRFCSIYVPYYRNLFIRIGFQHQDFKEINDIKKIPITTKELVRDNYNDFIPDYNIKYGIAQTSGSTGISTAFRISNKALERWIAAKQYGRIQHGIRPGDPILWIWGRRNTLKMTKRRKFIKENIENEYRISAFDISHENAINIANIIQSRKIKAIYGYSSAIYEFALILKEMQIYLPIKKVFVTAEKIYHHQKVVIEEVFKCSVISEYGAAEMGIISFECSHNKMHIVEENAFVETIDSVDTNFNHIIITDLNNYAMPLLRYQSGDLTNGIQISNCTCGSKHKLLLDIVGRQYDMIRLNNNKIIHGEMINYLVKEVTLKNSSTGLIHQFIQHSFNEFSLYLAAPHLDSSQKSKITKEFNEGFSNYLGKDYDFRLNVFFKDKIERPETGKHRFIISNLK